MKNKIQMLVAAALCAAAVGCATTGEERDVGKVLAVGQGIGKQAVPLVKGLASKSDNATVQKAAGWLSWLPWFGGDEPAAEEPQFPGGVELADFEQLPDGSFVPYIPPTNRIVTWTFPKPFISGVKSEPSVVSPPPQVMPPGWSNSLVPPMTVTNVPATALDKALQ